VKKPRTKKTEAEVVKAVDKLVKKLRLELKRIDRVAASWRTKKIC
jgi:hypothetical protein